MSEYCETFLYLTKLEVKMSVKKQKEHRAISTKFDHFKSMNSMHYQEFAYL